MPKEERDLEKGLVTDGIHATSHGNNHGLK